MSPQEFEARRRLAVQRVLEGHSQTHVANFLGVSPRAVRFWMRTYRRKGEGGLTSKPKPGRPRRLTRAQERTVLSWFRRSPTEFGFATELWSAPRVAQLIRQRWGIRFHVRYLNEWLTARNITPQKPRRVPRERDQSKIDRWVRDDWPRIKKGTPKQSSPRADR